MKSDFNKGVKPLLLPQGGQKMAALALGTGVGMRSHAGRWSCLFGLALWLFAGSASAVTIDWTPIGNAGNACETQSGGCFGAVAHAYSVGTYEVTNAQYAEFLNAKAASDPLALYNSNMGTSIYGGITQSGVSGSYTYSAIAGRVDMPVNF